MPRSALVLSLILSLSLAAPALLSSADAAATSHKTAGKPLTEQVGDLFRNFTSIFTHRLPTPEYQMSAPGFDCSPLPASKARALAQQFAQGKAGSIAPTMMVKAGAFKYHPLEGGIYKRRDTVHDIIMHSTETARVADATQIIHSWNERGMRHAGAQFIVERDGTIYMTLDPQWACVHVEPTRTLFGVNNDNAVGIEMVHTGNQQYTAAQLQSVERLVAYLKQRFQVKDSMILAHATVQPSDRRDPVNFDWQAFWKAEHKL